MYQVEISWCKSKSNAFVCKSRIVMETDDKQEADRKYRKAIKGEQLQPENETHSYKEVTMLDTETGVIQQGRFTLSEDEATLRTKHIL